MTYIRGKELNNLLDEQTKPATLDLGLYETCLNYTIIACKQTCIFPAESRPSSYHPPPRPPLPVFYWHVVNRVFSTSVNKYMSFSLIAQPPSPTPPPQSPGVATKHICMINKRDQVFVYIYLCYDSVYIQISIKCIGRDIIINLIKISLPISLSLSESKSNITPIYDIIPAMNETSKIGGT